MLNWLKRRMQIASLRAATEDLNRFLSSLRGMSSSELGMLVALATLLRIKLRNEGILPDNALGVGMPLLPGDELAVVLPLPRLIRIFQKQGQLTDAAAAMLWYHSVRVLLVYPELRVEGRALWHEVSRGFEHASDGLNDIAEITGEATPPEAHEMTSFMPPPLDPANT